MKLILNKNKIVDYLLILYISMSILGSYFYVASPSYSLGFVLAVIPLVFIVQNFTRKSLKSLDYHFLAFYFLFLISSFLAVATNYSLNNLRVFKFVVLLGVYFFLLKSLSVLKRQDLIDKAIPFVVVLILGVLLLQFLYIFTGIGLPIYDEDLAVVNRVPASVFGNPNDLSVVSLSLLIYILYFYKRKYKVLLIYALMAFILISASRGAIVLGLFFVGLNIKFSEIIKIKNIFIILVLLMIIYSNTDLFSEKFVYTINRIGSIFEHFGSGVSNRESSMGLRFNSLKYFFNNIFNVGFGSFSFKDYGLFFKGSYFYGGLMDKNPHNFFVELSLLYGVFGLLAILFFVSYMIRSLKSTRHHLLIIISVSLILCIPSSVINFLPIWAVLLNIILNEKISYK